MSIASLYPSINPSLLLDFANVKRLDPRITFVRTTTATYYDGVTTAKAEENLLTNSAAFTPFTTTGSSLTANSTTAPDGTSTAYTLTEDTANSTHRLNWGSPPSGSAGALSVYAKANSAGRYLYISTYTTAARIAIFDLSGAGTVTQSNASSTATITSVGNGWYRCSVSVNETVTYLEFGLSNATTGSTTTAPTYTGNGSSMYIWGPQFELRNAVTAYTATTSQAITNYIPVLQTAAAGQARFDHNPTTGESLGLLIEEARTNSQTYSSDFNNAAWAKTNATITVDTIVAPDGTLTGDKLVEDTTTGLHFVSAGAFAATTYAMSIYAKAGGRSAFALSQAGSASYIAYFDLSAGTVTSQTGVTASITPVGNGWYRCSTITNNPAGGGIYIFLSSGGISYAGNGFSGIFIWGAQLEAGSFATSYIPTVALTVTRNADAASMTGTNFSSWFNNGEGTLYAEASTSAANTAKRFAQIDSGAESNRIQIAAEASGTTKNFAVVTNSSTQAYTPVSASYPVKVGAGYKVNDFGASFNGGAIQTDTSGTVPALSVMRFGAASDASENMNGCLRKVSYYPAKATSAQIVGLTT